MEITNVSVMPLKHGKFDCVAICQFTIDDAFVITGLKLYKKNEKFYVVFPKNMHNKKQMKYCHPVSNAIYAKVLSAIVDEYYSLMTANNNIENVLAEDEFYKENFGESITDFPAALQEVENLKNAARIFEGQSSEELEKWQKSIRNNMDIVSRAFANAAGQAPRQDVDNEKEEDSEVS